MYPISTPEPLVLLTPPRCLTANRTQQGVLLTWLPPANHTSPIDRYIVEFRLGERWEVLDDLIPADETEIMARDLIPVKFLYLSGSMFFTEVKTWSLPGIIQKKGKIFFLKLYLQVFKKYQFDSVRGHFFYFGHLNLIKFNLNLFCCKFEKLSHAEQHFYLDYHVTL